MQLPLTARYCLAFFQYFFAMSGSRWGRCIILIQYCPLLYLTLRRFCMYGSFGTYTTQTFVSLFSVSLQIDRVYLSTPTKIAIIDHEKKRTYVLRKEGMPDAGLYLIFILFFRFIVLLSCLYVCTTAAICLTMMCSCMEPLGQKSKGSSRFS